MDVPEDERLDFHDYRHGLKLLTETRETVHYRNENEYDCPACGHTFAAVYASEKRHNTFDPDSARPFCLRNEPDRLLVFLH
jgi:hypothetical protein